MTDTEKSPKRRKTPATRQATRPTRAKRPSASAAIGSIARDPKHPWRSENIGRLLFVAFSAFEATLFDEIQKSGNGHVRQVHFHVLRHIDYDTGTRLVELARRAGITKGAMGQLASECQRLGLVAIRPDPVDRRAKLVTFSARGRTLMDHVGKILTRMERDIAKAVGAGRYRALRTTLSLLREELTGRRHTPD